MDREQVQRLRDNAEDASTPRVDWIGREIKVVETLRALRQLLDDWERMHAELDKHRMRVALIPTLCDWGNPNFDTPGSHEDWHHGSPCPYKEVVPAFLRGDPDPRRRADNG